MTATHARIQHAVTGIKADRTPHVSITDSEISASGTGLFVFDGPPGVQPWTEQQVTRTTFRGITGTAIVLNNARLVTSGLLVEQVGKVLYSDYASAVLAGQLSEVGTDPWVQALGTDPSRHGVDVTAAVTAAGVPMLPVVATPRTVARRVVAYSWAMVLTSVLLGLDGAGAVYTVSAVVLGGVFLWEAHVLQRRVVSGAAYNPMRLFHFSITYVTLLFLAVAVDPLLHLSLR